MMVAPDKLSFQASHFSPIMARPKSNCKPRVIVDLSWPHCNSVNPNVSDDILIKVPYY